MIRLRARRAAYNGLLRQLHEPWGTAKFFDGYGPIAALQWPNYAYTLANIGPCWRRCIQRKAALQ